MRTLPSIFSIVVSAALTVAASAATINVDFGSGGVSGTFSGTAKAPDAGTVWNGFNAGAGGIGATTVFPGTLVTSTGAPSTVTLSLTNFFSFDAGSGSASGIAPALMTDFIYQPGGVGPGGNPGTFSIGGLVPLATYDFYIYSQNAGFQNTATTFTIGGTTKVATNAGQPPGTPLTTTFIENTNYLRILGITASAGGIITGSFNDVAVANNAAFNGFQIVQVPEPSMLALTGLASALLLRRRRS
jgi:hypothetical protein